MSYRVRFLGSLAFGALLVLVSLTSLALAEPGPSLVMSIDPPEITIEVCTNTTLTATVHNGGDPTNPGDDLSFVALTAVLGDSALIEFLPASEYDVRILDAAGVPRWTGSASCMSEQVYYERFGGTCDAVTLRLPTDIVLRAGETLELDIPVHCIGVGDVAVEVFPRATEDHHDIPPADLSSLTDQTNIYYWPGGKQVAAGWYPLHNSLDPQDAASPAGHTFQQHSWSRSGTVTAFAKAKVLIMQEERHVTRESDCFTQQAITIPVEVAFQVGHKLKVAVSDVSVDFGPKVLPGTTYRVEVPFTVWSNDDVECRVTSTGFVGSASGTVIDGQPTASIDGRALGEGSWVSLTQDLGTTGTQGLSCDLELELVASYSWVPDVYTGDLLFELRQY